MKSPEQLSAKLTRQWGQANTRETRLLEEPESWPLLLPIGKPPPALIRTKTDEVRAHIEEWRTQRLGTVHWKEVCYQATHEAITIPHSWEIPDCLCWIQIINDKTITAEFKVLQEVLHHTDAIFHSLLIRRRALWKSLQTAQIISACRLALELQPGCAQNLPLRALSLGGHDTKFFERHEQLLLALLDVLYDGEPSQIGLTDFLGAYSDRQHWLLIADLDGNLLPYQRIRLTSTQIEQTPLPGSNLLIVENENCLHQLPHLANTIAVLGTGFDLKWLSAPWLKEREVIYWGDLDTWGLDCLARARKELPSLTPILMDRQTYTTHHSHAVPEPKPQAQLPLTASAPPRKSFTSTSSNKNTGASNRNSYPKKPSTKHS